MGKLTGGLTCRSSFRSERRAPARVGDRRPGHELARLPDRAEDGAAADLPPAQAAAGAEPAARRRARRRWPSACARARGASTSPRRSSAAICRDPRRDRRSSAPSRRRPTSARSSGPASSAACTTCSAAGFRRSTGRPGGPHDPAARASGCRTGEVREVILATNPSLEGEATALYVQRQLAAHAGWR